MRIPFARGHGAYARVGNQDMFTAVLQALVAKYRLAGERLGDVVGGAVLKHSKDFNLVRECVLSSGLDAATPGIDMQRACGTGLDAAIVVAMKIALGQMDAGIAGGFDYEQAFEMGQTEVAIANEKAADKYKILVRR